MMPPFLIAWAVFSSIALGTCAWLYSRRSHRALRKSVVSLRIFLVCCNLLHMLVVVLDLDYSSMLNTNVFCTIRAWFVALIWANVLLLPCCYNSLICWFRIQLSNYKLKYKREVDEKRVMQQMEDNFFFRNRWVLGNHSVFYFFGTTTLVSVTGSLIVHFVVPPTLDDYECYGSLTYFDGVEVMVYYAATFYAASILYATMRPGFLFRTEAFGNVLTHLPISLVWASALMGRASSPLRTVANITAYTELLSSISMIFWLIVFALISSFFNSEGHFSFKLPSSNNKVRQNSFGPIEEFDLQSSSTFYHHEEFYLVLCDPNMLDAFKQFCSSSFSVEHILFWLDCVKYRELQSEAEREAAAIRMREMFLFPNAFLEVNIDDKLRKKLIEQIEQKDFSTMLFVEPEQIVYRLMYNSLFKRWKILPDYARAVKTSGISFASLKERSSSLDVPI